MGLFCGIDPSLTGCAVVLIDDTGTIIEEKLISTNPDCYINSDQRLLDIVDQVKSIFTVSNLRFVCVEGLSFFSVSPSLYERCGLLYLITTSLFEKDIRYEVIPPKSLKKFAAGNGNADKKMMIQEVNKRWNQNFKDDNICDAYSLAQMALSRNGKHG